MSERTLLWVDLTLQKSTTPTTRYFEDYFRIRQNLPGSLAKADGTNRPDALCFDFDFPDRSGLRLLEETKRLHPSIPILMLTVQHSEELAVWAFRARVWDYFTKPVQRHDVERCYESLCKVDMSASARRSIRTPTPLPLENRLGRFTSGNERVLAPAISHVQSHYSEKIVQSQVAAMCGMSTFRFSRVFHNVFGKTFQDYLIGCRIERAEELLLNPALGISDVGYAVGFRDPSYFSRVFRTLHQMSPTQWRQQRLREQRPDTEIERPGLRLRLDGDEL